jgi:nucleotide-binding universal stress UspA family protein
MSGILVGVDGSGHSAKALEWAAREAAARKASLTVLAVHPAMAGCTGRSAGYAGDRELAEGARLLAQEQLDKVLAGLDEASIPALVTVRAVTGLPADELLTASVGADMIVVGSGGAGGSGRLLLGSVASQVTHHARVPVVIIRTERL